MNKYIVKLENKSLLRKSEEIVQADNFARDLLSGWILFKNKDNENVAMFHSSDIESVKRVEE